MGMKPVKALDIENEYLRPVDLAKLLRVTEKTLSNQRVKRIGIPFRKFSRAVVLYRRSDVEAYLDAQSKLLA
jgi:Helix-turn-helix domain